MALRVPRPVAVATVLLTAVTGTVALAAVPAPRLKNLQPFANGSGVSATFSSLGDVDLSNPFFRSLGRNGRACVHCHQPGEGWSITPAGVRTRFEATGGTDPIFRTNDGSNSPRADVSTLTARRRAYSMLLNKALIRVGKPIPTGAEFKLVTAQDPYGFASASELSLFRRPLPSTNLRFLSDVMWDGRETQFADTVTPPGVNHTFKLRESLLTQAIQATLGHAEAAPGVAADLAPFERIVDLELSLATAQTMDRTAGDLTQNATGGPLALSRQPFHTGINDPVIPDPRGGPFTPRVFTLFDAWKLASGRGIPLEARKAVERGQAIFNQRPIEITGVGGINDVTGRQVVPGTCSSCHNTPNGASASMARPLNIGLSDENRRTPDMPLYTLQKLDTGETVRTTDPGRALVTGRWSDVGKFKTPLLRGLAARAPYFHNGSAATLEAVVDFYNQRFRMNLTPGEKADLAAFLRCL
jgi:cytochrome c peroxidase